MHDDEEYAYSPYGSLSEGIIDGFNEYWYKGEVHDNQSLQYLRARYYHTELTQFISIDAYKGSDRNPLSQNRYSFASNNPYKYSDPSGHRIVSIIENELGGRIPKPQPDPDDGDDINIIDPPKPPVSDVNDTYNPGPSNTYLSWLLLFTEKIKADFLAQQQAIEDSNNQNTDPDNKGEDEDDKLNGVISSIEIITDKLKDLQKLAEEYKIENNYHKSTKELVLSYTRNYSGYNDGKWVMACGKIERDLVKYVDERNSELSYYFGQQIYFVDPQDGYNIDLNHLLGTMNVYVHNTNVIDAGIKAYMPEYRIDALGESMGDLQSLLSEVILNNDSKGLLDYEKTYDLMSEYIGSTKISDETNEYDSLFSMSDLIANVDATNMYGYDEDIAIYKVFADYYAEDYTHRYTDYVGNDDYYIIYNKTHVYTKLKYLGAVTWPMLKGVEITPEQSRAAAWAYTDFLWELVQNERRSNH